MGDSYDNALAESVNGLADGLGSTIGLVDDTGIIATSYDYGPFGSTATQGAADANPFQFTGREHDETGLYYYRARYYDPDLGRFISEDPIGLSSGDPNLYAYVANSPTNGTDPSGLCNLGLLTEEFVLLEQYHTEASALIVQFQSGAIGSDDFVAAFQAAGHALTTGVLAAAAVNCAVMPIGGAFGGVPGSSRPALSASSLPSRAAAAEVVRGATPVGSALKSDVYHRSAVWAVDDIASTGSVYSIVGEDGVERLLVQVPGELNGITGRFEWTVDAAGNLTHQRFVKGGAINGVPNIP